jgi:hypothetical protein
MKHHVVTREPVSLDPRSKISHHASTIVLGTKAEVEDHDLCHQGATTVHDMKEADNPNIQGTHTIMRTTRKRWGRHALLTEFAGHQYPKDLSYLTINRNTMALRNLGHGYQTTCK